MQKKDRRVKDVNLARTFAVFEDEGHNIERRKVEAEQQAKKKD